MSLLKTLQPEVKRMKKTKKIKYTIKIFSHDCLALMEQEAKGLANVEENPLTNPDLELFVDGSRYYVDGVPHTGAAITDRHQTLLQMQLPPSHSAQEAEIQALTEACIMAEGRTANIYTDSRYAYGVAHDFGPIWKTRNFLSATGKPIKHADKIRQLFRALELPKKGGHIEGKGT